MAKTEEYNQLRARVVGRLKETQLSRREFLKLAGILTVATLLSACAPGVAQDLLVKATATANPEPTGGDEGEVKPTEIVPTATNKAEVTATPPVKLNEGGPINLEQMAEYEKLWKEFQKWWEYWSGAPSKPVSADAIKGKDVIAHIKRDLNGGPGIGVLFQIGPGDLYTFPWQDGYKKEIPTEYTSEGDPLPGCGFLRLAETGKTDAGTPFTLQWNNGRWEQRDEKGGVLKIIAPDGVWMDVEKESMDIKQKLKARAEADLAKYKEKYDPYLSKGFNFENPLDIKVVLKEEQLGRTTYEARQTMRVYNFETHQYEPKEIKVGTVEQLVWHRLQDPVG